MRGRRRAEPYGVTSAMAGKNFESALARLEEIVKKLEKGDLPLEQSLKLFEEGVKLARVCNKRLEEAERKVEILLKDKEGKLAPKPFEEEE
jgi:exodeoxyribonuclease VII small subunit